MNIKIVIAYKDIRETLDISEDRYDFIISYIMQMIHDCKGNVVDIIKEVKLNLKEKEKHVAMYIVGSSSNPIYSKLSDEEKEELVRDVIVTLKIRREVAELITCESEKIIDDMRKADNNLTIQKIVKEVAESHLDNVNKDYLLFMLGLMVF